MPFFNLENSIASAMPLSYDVYSILSFMSMFSVCMPLVVGLVKKVYFKNDSEVLFYLICTSFLIEAIIFVLRFNHLNNLYVIRINTLIEFTLLSLFFLTMIPNPGLKLMIKIIIFLFMAIAMADLALNGFKLMDNISSAVEAIVLMVYTVIAFYYLVLDPPTANIFSTPRFWFYTGILTYFSCDLFLFIFSNYIQSHSTRRLYELWSIHSVSNIVFYLLISIGFWKTEIK